MSPVQTNRYLLAVFALIVVFIPQAAPAEQPLSDKAKKTIVYQMYADYKKEFPEVKDISPREAMALLSKNNVVFVDTREQAERAVSKLPQSITQADFLKNPRQFKDKKVIGYCTISYRSGLFARELASRGVTLYNLQGGVLAWVLEGGKVYDEQGETKRIHVYSEKWNYAPNGYEAVMFGFWDRIF